MRGASDVILSFSMSRMRFNFTFGPVLWQSKIDRVTFFTDTPNLLARCTTTTYVTSQIVCNVLRQFRLGLSPSEGGALCEPERSVQSQKYQARCASSSAWGTKLSQ